MMSNQTDKELSEVLNVLSRTASLTLQPHEREALHDASVRLLEPKGVRVEGTATYESDEWRFEEGGLVGDPKATLIVYDE